MFLITHFSYLCLKKVVDINLIIDIFIESKKQKTRYFTAVTHFFFELPQYYHINKQRQKSLSHCEPWTPIVEAELE